MTSDCSAASGLCRRALRLCAAAALLLPMASATAQVAGAPACLVAPTGIVTWLSADGISRNLQGTGNDGTLLNGAGYAAGRAGLGFHFDGVDDHVRLPNDFYDFYTQPFTIELWFRTTSGGVILGEQTVDALDPSVGQSVPGIYVGTDGVLYVETFWAGSIQQIASPVLVNDGQWQHLASTQDGTTRRVYLNGTLIGQSTAGRLRYAQNLRYQLGTGVGFNRTALPGTSFYSFAGDIDEFTVYDHALTQNEIIDAVNAGSSGKCLAPLPYLQRSDSPLFAGVQAGTVQLEDCEDDTVNLTGATLDASCAGFGPAFTDSVDGDDGVVDGSGSNGNSLYRGSAPITVTFSNPLPTVAGLVWTDLSFQNGITFQAFDANDTLIANVFATPPIVATNGNTAEDRFFGVRNDAGIARMTISNAGDIEIDHVQFGTNGTPPSTLLFPARSNVPLNRLQLSTTVVVSGILDGSAVTVAGGSYSLNGGAASTAAGTLNNGDRIVLRHTSAAQPGTAVSTTLTVAGVPTSFTSTTEAADTTPAAFAFRSVSGATRAQTLTSEGVRIGGINTATPISVTGGSYRLNNGAYTTAAGSLRPGDLVTLRHTAAAAAGTQTVTRLSIGGVQGTFTSTTAAADTRPDAFAFPARGGVARATPSESAVVRIGGINAPTAVSVAGGSYRVNGGAYTTAAGTLNAGDSLQVRLLSAATAATRSTVTATVGGVSGSYSVTTAAAAAAPP